MFVAHKVCGLLVKIIQRKPMGSLLFAIFSANPHSSPVGGSNSLVSWFSNCNQSQRRRICMESEVAHVALSELLDNPWRTWSFVCCLETEHHETSPLIFSFNSEMFGRNGVNLVSTWCRATAWCKPGVNLVSTWCQPGVEPQPGVNLVSTWCQPGVNLV